MVTDNNLFVFNDAEPMNPPENDPYKPYSPTVCTTDSTQTHPADHLWLAYEHVHRDAHNYYA